MRCFATLLPALMLAANLHAQPVLLAYWDQNSNNLPPPAGGFGFTPASFPQPADDGLYASNANLRLGDFDTTLNSSGAYSCIPSFAGTVVNATPSTPSGGSLSVQGCTTALTNNGMFVEFRVPTTGHENIVLSFALQATASGFDTRSVSYSVDGGVTYVPFAVDSGRPSSFERREVDFSSVAAVNDLPELRVRMRLTGATAGTGNNRIDNIRFEGTAISSGPPPVPVLEIFEIQGTGLRSPFAPPSGNALGDEVRTEGNVVTAVAPDGFFMQTPDARDDGNPLSSNGIFVFTGAAPAVVVGDIVDVQGRVQEFFNWTQIAGSPTVSVVGSGAPLPAPVVFDENLPSTDPANLTCGHSNFECFESMLVHVPAGFIITGNQTFSTDPFAENFVNTGAFRARREEGLLFGLSFPSAPHLPVWDGNPEVFELDADALGTVPPNTPINGGGLFSATGVIAYRFGNHVLWTTELDLIDNPLPRPVPAPVDARELRVGSFNVLNLCDQGCGSSAPTPAEFALKVARLSDYIGNVLRLPDVLGLQEVENASSLQALVDRIALDHGLTYQFFLGVGNDPRGIRNAFLVNPSRVKVTRVRDLGATETIDQCSGPPPCPKHDRPPMLLEGEFSAGDGERFAVIVVHNRSLSGITDTGPSGDRIRYKRRAQGLSIAAFVQRFQTGQELDPNNPVGDTDTVGVPLLVVGDFNGFEVTDGMVDIVGLIAGTYDNSRNLLQIAENIVDPPLHNLVFDLPLDERYSFQFRENLGNIQGQTPRQVGSIQVLDHALLNLAGARWCGRKDYGRGNSDAPRRLLQTGTDAVASSDHDGFVVTLFTDRLFADGFDPVAGYCR